ncbi:receptor-type tyrosine-protein phosphatase S isoform X6 [Nematostella vectensis]|uniref:receptor-type tyrosine-protein phosphatase S isoform X6 n=1 Tax=Nematostella vectensis TaxID=45351 RepID=UPI0020775B81|nr:receptor-type tyrosine-protein phosphatase S isoform X6 [Nematostella vectensis]
MSLQKSLVMEARDRFCSRVAFAVLFLQFTTVYTEGCPGQAVGISNSRVLPDNRFSASTIYDSRYHPYYARLNGSPGWCRKSSDPKGYLQIDLNAVFVVCAVATQGASYGTEWVTSYKVQFSMDNQAWSTYRETGTDKVFNGNTDGTTVVKNTLAVPTMARFIRFVPLTSQRDPTMRVEVYGTKPDVCKSSLGLTDDVIAGSAISASSGNASAGRLYGNSSWCGASVVSEYLEIDLGGVRTVSGVATQGSPGENKWVKTYNLHYTTDGTRWLMFKSLNGNANKGLTVINWFNHKIRARYVRITPLTWNSAICLRADLFGNIECYPDGKIVISQATSTSSTAIRVEWTTSANYRLNGIFKEYIIQYEYTASDGQRITNTRKITDTNMRHLELSSLRKFTNYTLTVNASNSRYAGATSDARIIQTLEDAPDCAPTILSTMAMTSTSIRVNWRALSDACTNGIVRKYVISYHRHGGSEQTTEVIVPKTSVDISNLAKYTQYTVKVRGCTVSDGPWSAPYIGRTREDAPDCAPTSLSTTVMTSTSIRVTWSALPGTCTNGIVRKYVISYHKNGGSDETTEINAPRTSFDISDLEKYTEYTIKVCGYTVKHGPWNTPVVARTKPDVPEGIPTISRIAPGSSTSVDLTWTFTATDKIYGEFQGFNITYKEEGGGTLYNTTNHMTRSFTITGLKKFTYYEVSVSVRNHVFKGPDSTATQVRTDEDVPSASPSAVSHSEINSTTFNISWSSIPKDQRNGIITSYDLELSSGQARRRRWSIPESFTSTLTYIVLHNLESCTIYHLRVRARTGKGPGPYSPQYTLQTSPPGTPTALMASKETETSVLLKWRPPDFVGSVSYTITYRGMKSYWPKWKGHKGEITTSSQSVTKDDLIPGTKYIFNITSSTKCGTSKPVTFTALTTKVAEPVAPTVGRISRDTNVTLWRAEQINGPIDSYQVIVLKVKSDNVNLTEIQAEALCEDDKQRKKRNYYIVAELDAFNMNRTIIIGDEKKFTGRQHNYKNKALEKGSNYKVYIRGMTYLGDEKVDILCGKVALAGIIEFSVEIKENKIADPPTPVGAVAGGIVVLLLLLAVAAFLFLIIRRRRSRESSKRKPAMQMDSINNGIEEESTSDQVDEGRSNQQQRPVDLVDDGDSNRREIAEAGNNDGIYDNAVDDLSKPISVAHFPKYVAIMQANRGIRLEAEYKNVSNEQQFSWDAARKAANKKKNRYGNIVTYDHSRVVLERVNGDEDSDYINASFIHGFDGTPRSYIASQGPPPPTFEGFWRMVWEQNSQSIVMLTNLVELGKTKCHKYWPDKTETYGGVTVTLHQSEVFAGYENCTFILSKEKRSGSRIVRQFHFTVWPDKGVPQYATAVLAFRRKVRALNPRDAGPVIVHCSVGVERTGAYIVIDAMLEQAKKSRTVDIRNYLIAIRKHRPHMVQTKEQYSFIHSAVLEALTCGNTEIQSEKYNQAMQKLASVNGKFPMTGYALEFQRLNSVTSREIPAEEKSVGEEPQNLHKNRFSDIIALNSCRVMLHKEHADEESDYINAVFLHAHRGRNAFIATQHPLLETVEDFWRMVTDYDIGTIVMLNNLHELDQEYPKYWPDHGPTKYGHIGVSVLSKQEQGDVICTKLKVTRKKKTHEVRHLHHVSWPDKCIPEVACSVLDLLDEAQTSQQQCGNAPVLVQCSNGVGRSGTFCAISSVLERLKTEQVIDVFQVIKRIRVNLPGAVESPTQYMFCYQIIQKYLDSFSDYANYSDC